MTRFIGGRRARKDNSGVYGARKVRLQLRRGARPACLMRDPGLPGVRRGAFKKTAVPDESAPRPVDLVNRKFIAIRPDEVWAADITYVSTRSGSVRVSFVTDVFSKRILGWRVPSSLKSDLALELLRWRSGRAAETWTASSITAAGGVQYLSIRYTERLAGTGCAVRGVEGRQLLQRPR